MKTSTFVTVVLSVSILAALVALLAFRTSPSKAHASTDRNVTNSQTSHEAAIPVTGAGQKSLAPSPLSDAKGKALAPQPAANRLIAPVYDAKGMLVSDPTGTMLNTNH